MGGREKTELGYVNLGGGNREASTGGERNPKGAREDSRSFRELTVRLGRLRKVRTKRTIQR